MDIMDIMERFKQAGPHRDIDTPEFFRGHSFPPNFSETMEKRRKIQDLYKSDDAMWDLGDLEFEAGLRDYLEEQNDTLALMGLEEHLKKGGNDKWLDLTPLDPYGGSRLGAFMFPPTKEANEDMADMSTLGWFTEGDDLGGRRIDLNLKNIMEYIDKFEKETRKGVPHELGDEWSLQNAIYDLYAHELSHGVSSLNEFRDLGLEHPAIYYNSYLHAKHPAFKQHGLEKAENWNRMWEDDPLDAINIPPDAPKNPHIEFESNQPKILTDSALQRSNDKIKKAMERYPEGYLDRSMIDIVKDILDEVTEHPQRISRFNKGGIASL